MSPEIELMEYLASITGIPLKPFVERDSKTGYILENNKPYAIMGDIRTNHQQALYGDYVSGGFVISGFFPKQEGRKAEEWGEFIRRRLLRDTIETSGHYYTFKTVRKQVRKDITTQSILHRVTITVVFDRSNKLN